MEYMVPKSWKPCYSRSTHAGDFIGDPVVSTGVLLGWLDDQGQFVSPDKLLPEYVITEPAISPPTPQPNSTDLLTAAGLAEALQKILQKALDDADSRPLNNCLAAKSKTKSERYERRQGFKSGLITAQLALKQALADAATITAHSEAIWRVVRAACEKDGRYRRGRLGTINPGGRVMTTPLQQAIERSRTLQGQAALTGQLIGKRATSPDNTGGYDYAIAANIGGEYRVVAEFFQNVGHGVSVDPAANGAQYISAREMEPKFREAAAIMAEALELAVIHFRQEQDGSFIGNNKWREELLRGRGEAINSLYAKANAMFGEGE